MVKHANFVTKHLMRTYIFAFLLLQWQLPVSGCGRIRTHIHIHTMFTSGVEIITHFSFFSSSMSGKFFSKFHQVQKIKNKNLECRFISGISEKILRQRNGFALISNGQFFFGDYFGKTFF
jgi:hypothetical protein